MCPEVLAELAGLIAILDTLYDTPSPTIDGYTDFIFMETYWIPTVWIARLNESSETTTRRNWSLPKRISDRLYCFHTSPFTVCGIRSARGCLKSSPITRRSKQLWDTPRSVRLWIFIHISHRTPSKIRYKTWVQKSNFSDKKNWNAQGICAFQLHIVLYWIPKVCQKRVRLGI